jgi:putative flippase GtrA
MQSQKLKSVLLKFVGFAGVGAIATGIQCLILIALKELGGVPPVYASAIGYAVSSVLNYLMKYHWVFASDRKHRHAAPRYATVSVIGLSLNTALMYLGTHVLGWYYLLAQVLTTGLVLLWNFFANATWTFGAIGGKRPDR